MYVIIIFEVRRGYPKNICNHQVYEPVDDGDILMTQTSMQNEFYV